MQTVYLFFFSSRRRHTRLVSDWSSDVCSSDLALEMLREQSAYEVESRLKGDVLQDLFTGSYRDEDEAAGLLRRLGYTLPGAYRVARVEAAASGDREGRPARWQEEMQGPHSRLY